MLKIPIVCKSCSRRRCSYSNWLGKEAAHKPHQRLKGHTKPQLSVAPFKRQLSQLPLIGLRSF
jgi:hypothetical protein